MKKKQKPKPPIKKKYIETPEKLWELFEAYIKHVDDNPILVHDFVGKDGDSVERKKQRPLTMEGFEVFVWKQGLNAELKDYFANRDDRYGSYVPICSRIRLSIRANQIEGGMAGIYNPSITQRINGLVERQQNEMSGSVQVQISGMEIK